MIQQIPSAQFIEIAKDTLKTEPSWKEPDMLKELHVAVGDTSTDFKRGYLLGLETMEVLAEMQPRPQRLQNGK